MSGTVAVRDLRKSYGTLEAARGISFDVNSGEVFGLIGPNGAGKTTTLECILGLREPDAGHIDICDIDARKHPRAVKALLGAALQSTSLHDRITPREALDLFGAFYRKRVETTALLARFSLTAKADARVDQLSGGQRQRLALALAFVNDPEIVVLDEPTSGLDPQSRHELHIEIRRMKDEGRTVLLTTHDLDEAESLCDRIAIVNHGVIVAIGTPSELIVRATTMQTLTCRMVPPIDPRALDALPGAEGLTVTGDIIRFQTATLHTSLSALLLLADRSGAMVTDLHAQKATLEDVFLALTSARESAS